MLANWEAQPLGSSLTCFLLTLCVYGSLQLNRLKPGLSFSHTHLNAITFKCKKIPTTKSKKDAMEIMQGLATTTQQVLAQQQRKQGQGAAAAAAKQDEEEESSSVGKAITQYVSTGPVKLNPRTLPECKQSAHKNEREAARASLPAHIASLGLFVFVQTRVSTLAASFVTSTSMCRKFRWCAC